MAYKKTYARKDSGREKSSAPSSDVRVLNKDGVTYVKAWMYRKFNGFVTFFVSPPKGSAKVRESKRGIKWHSCKVVITNHTHMSRSVFPAWMEPGSHNVYIKDLNMRLSPQTKRVHIFEKTK